MSNKIINQRAKVNPKKMLLPKNEQRILKVHTRYKPDERTVTTIPEIVLKGNWLKDLGFQCGELVKVVTAGPILQIIRTVTENEKQKWGQTLNP